MSDMAADVIAMIAKRVPGEQRDLQMSDKLTDLGLESIDAIDMIFDLEEKFDIEIPYNANDTRPEFDTVDDVVRAVEGLVAAKA